MKKRIFAMILVTALMVGLIPVSILAEDNEIRPRASLSEDVIEVT